jgi:sigma-B regulation protein RsbU (phosphoserine phosphatase)
MKSVNFTDLRRQLKDRRKRLKEVIQYNQEASHLTQLLQEVDSALARMDTKTYGLCEICHDPIEKDRLLADPLTHFCLDHLDTEQQRALEQDLYLASRIQGALLPTRNMKLTNWNIYYSYLPAGPVSGDYCDLVNLPEKNGDFLFILGDVSGKGFAASMLMTHLQAMFHSLVAFDLPVNQLVERANRLFCESTQSSHYATLACGRATAAGKVEITNAGHWPLLLIRKDQTERIEATGMPIGFFCSGQYLTKRVQLEAGDSLLLYTDGLTEAMDKNNEYGTERLIQLSAGMHSLSAKEIVDNCLRDLRRFLNGSTQLDDLSVMSLKWMG